LTSPPSKAVGHSDNNSILLAGVLPVGAQLSVVALIVSSSPARRVRYRPPSRVANASKVHGAVVARERDQPRAAGFDLVEHVGGVAFADGLPWRVGVAEHGLWHQRGPGGVDWQVQSADYSLDGHIQGLPVTARIFSIGGWPQPLMTTSPKPRTLTTMACSLM
jgi:hypothetical protein